MKKHLVGMTIVVLISSLFIGLPKASANGTVIEEECANAGYSKGFFIKTCDEDFKLKINVQLQTQYQFLSIEGAAKINTFQIRRARLIFKGNAFDPDLTYKFQFEAKGGRVSTATEGDGATGPNLRDAWLNYRIVDGFQVKGGQLKTAFNREELTSSSKLQFVDRSINNEVFTHGRSLAVQFHGHFLDKAIEYAVYFANDAARRNITNLNNEMLLGGRFVWNALGYIGYTMSDLKDREDVALSFGVAGAVDRPMVAANDPTLIYGSFDTTLMWAGFSFLGEFNYMRNQTVGTNTLGFLGQVGYFLIPEHFEVALRGAAVIPRGAATNGYETGAALNYFFKGHNLKIQADYNILWNSALISNVNNAPAIIARTGGAPGFIQNQNDHRARLQAQLVF